MPWFGASELRHPIEKLQGDLPAYEPCLTVRKRVCSEAGRRVTESLEPGANLEQPCFDRVMRERVQQRVVDSAEGFQVG